METPCYRFKSNNVMLVLHCLWENTVNQFWLLHSMDPVSFSASVLDSILSGIHNLNLCLKHFSRTTPAWYPQKWAENQSSVPFPVNNMLFFSILLGLFISFVGSYGVIYTRTVTIRNPVISLQGRWCKLILLLSVLPHQYLLQCKIDKLRISFTVHKLLRYFQINTRRFNKNIKRQNY